MGINGNRFKKQDVYKLAKETKKFLELLNGITIQIDMKVILKI